MFEQVTAPPAQRNVALDVLLRIAIAIAFIAFGAEKFPSHTGSQWVKLFQEIGWGQWFRYCTGVVEILGGVLIAIPWTVNAGLAILAATMASAVLILTFVIGRPGDSVIAAGFCAALVGFWWSRRRQ